MSNTRFCRHLLSARRLRWEGVLAVLVAIASFGICPLASAQYLRIVAYNTEADIDGYTAPRDGFFTVLEAIGQQTYAGIQQPVDILALEETTNNSATVAPIVAALNAYYGAGTYAMATYQGTQRGSASNGNGPNAMIYNTRTVSLVLQNGAQGVGVSGTPGTSTGGVPRQAIRYEFLPLNAPAATAFYVYVSHMKSSFGGTTDAILATRNAEAQLITADVAGLSGAAALAVGDFNMDGSTEPAYQTLTTSGPFIDPLNNGPQDNNQTWNVAKYKAIMTESSTSLSYRDDIEFMTADVYGGTSAAGLHYVPGSCRAFGNNGTTSVGGSTNTAKNTSLNTNFTGPIAASDALAALTTGSDHLPIVADYFFATPYTNWQVNHFSAAELRNVLISADNADPDGDGLANLTEYALGLDPRVASVKGLPLTGRATVDGKQYVTLTFTKVISATDITYVPQVSGNLAAWSSGAASTAQVGAINNPDGLTQTVTVRDLTPASGAGARFMRLMISRP